MPEANIIRTEKEQQAVRRTLAWRVDEYGELEKYRLATVAGSAAEVIHYAGGLLFDRVMSGWEITVLVADSRDVRALHILGVDVVDLEVALEWRGHQRLCPQGLAVTADLFESDPRVRAGVLTTLALGTTEVMMLGASCPDALERELDCTTHHLSTAARAFKAHALAAAAAPVGAVPATEEFYVNDNHECSSARADLISIELLRTGI